MRSLVIGNVTEFNHSHVRGLFVPSEWAMWRRAGDELADMAAFWGGDDKVLLVPRGTDREWLGDLGEDLGWTLDLVEPRPTTGRLLDDAVSDAASMARLADLLPETVTVEAWGATASLLRFNGALRAMGVDARLRAPHADKLWTVGYLDSKLALDDLAQRVPELRVPASYTAVTYEHLLGLAKAMIAEARPFVVKSNVGVGGFGMFADPDPDPLDEAATLDDLVAALGAEPIFREGPFLVQEWKRTAPGTLHPTFNGIVRGVDDVESVGVGGMLVDECVYRGVVVGEEPVAAPALADATRVGRAVGMAASCLGFRGWYDVDFVLAESGDLYATEINARRTSPAHAFAVLDRWQRFDPRIRCVLADDHIPVSRSVGASWAELRPVFESVRAADLRCSATIVRTLRAQRPTVGVVIGAATQERAFATREELAARLSHRTSAFAV